MGSDIVSARSKLLNGRYGREHGKLWESWWFAAVSADSNRFDNDSLSIADTLDQISPPTVCHAPPAARANWSSPTWLWLREPSFR
jgi:hypothetical protein